MECSVPVEDEGVCRVEQTEESNAVYDRLSDDQFQVACRTVGSCEDGTH